MYSFLKDSAGAIIDNGGERFAVNSTYILKATGNNQIIISTDDADLNLSINKNEIAQIDGVNLTGSESLDSVIQMIREVFA
jgi:hypothetical protein